MTALKLPPVLEVRAAAHVVEALFAVQVARRALAGGRSALGPVAGDNELWKRLDSLVSTVDGVLADLTLLGMEGLQLHTSHSGTGCPICSPRADEPTYYTGGRR